MQPLRRARAAALWFIQAALRSVDGARDEWSRKRVSWIAANGQRAHDRYDGFDTCGNAGWIRRDEFDSYEVKPSQRASVYRTPRPRSNERVSGSRGSRSKTGAENASSSAFRHLLAGEWAK